MTTPKKPAPNGALPPRLHGAQIISNDQHNGEWVACSGAYYKTHCEQEWLSRQEHEAILRPLVEALEFYAERNILERANQFPGDDELIDVSHIAKDAIEAHRKEKP